MSLNWMDVSQLSFNTLLLFERIQISWFSTANIPKLEMSIAVSANPAVEWYLRHKCPEINPWINWILSFAPSAPSTEQIRAAEIAVLRSLEDLVVYAIDPATYDSQPFLGWDSGELLGLADFTAKRVVDVGAGTGRLALAAVPLAAEVYAVEPVGNLRDYLRKKAISLQIKNLYVVDGLITCLPFPDGFADIAMGGHVFGDEPEEETDEIIRITRPGGLVIFCPGNNDLDDDRHQFLLSRGFSWGRFEEPRDGIKRKYWKIH